MGVEMSGHKLKFIFLFIIVISFLLAVIKKTNSNEKYFNKYNSAYIPWDTSIPESLGVNSDVLYKLADELEDNNTHCLLFIKNNKILFEWYNDKNNADIKHFIASTSKAIVGSLGLLLALQDSLLSLEDYACTYIPHWKDDSLKSKIKIKHLANHTSGLQDARLPEVFNKKELPDWMGKYWKEKNKRFEVSLFETPVIFEPGSRLDYSNTAVSALSYIISKVISAHNQDLKQNLNNKIYSILGLTNDTYEISYNESFEYDGLNLYEIGGGGYFTTRAAAKIVQLFLNYGKINNSQIIDSSLIVKTIRNCTSNDLLIPKGVPAPGLLWWTNENKIWDSLPEDAFIAMGADHQILLGIPSLDIIVVRFGSTLSDRKWGEYSSQGYPAEMWEAMNNYIFKPVMESLSLNYASF